uniref:Uncharacterized protein n=1 Tax=Tanacetum cinerariifolium TaxID=118510 RepID=A0A6L2NQY3_TANCI|nr:hypothetical protein [Tanacetum cinerariifolium]
MIANHSKDMSVKEVLMMVLVMHTEEDDMVLHIEKTGMLMLVVEIDVGGMTADVVDKLNCSSDDVQPRQVDMRSVHALTELHWHDTHVDPDRHEVDQLKRYCFHKFTMSSCYGKDVPEMLSLDDMLRVRLCEAGSDEEIFTSVAWIRSFNINEPICVVLCHEFYSTYKFDEVCAGDELQSKKIIRFRLGRRAYNLTLLDFAQRLGLYQVTKLEEEGFNVYFEGEDVVRSLSALIYCRDLDTTTLRGLIDYGGKLILEDLQLGVPIPPRASMQDLYDRMGRMEIHQEAIKHMEYRQSYYWDMYHGVFEHIAGVYSVPLQGAYNPPGYAQPQYDQYYQQYQPPPPQYQQQQDADE